MKERLGSKSIWCVFNLLIKIIIHVLLKIAYPHNNSSLGETCIKCYVEVLIDLQKNVRSEEIIQDANGVYHKLEESSTRKT